MKKTNWKDNAELVGIAAIVASLVFVGLQMKQSQEIALSSAYQARADSSIDIRSLPLESPELLSAVTKSSNLQADELTPDEQTALTFFFATELIYLENTHYQYLHGFVSEEQWKSNRGDLKSLFKRPVIRQIWEQGFGSWRDSFVKEIELVLSELDAEGS